MTARHPDAKAVLRRYLIAMMPYIREGVSLGGDYGTNYSDILAVFREFGFDMPLTKSMRDDKKIVENAAAYNKLLEQTVDTVPINDVIAGYGVAEARTRHICCLWKHGKYLKKVSALTGVLTVIIFGPVIVM